MKQVLELLFYITIIGIAVLTPMIIVPLFCNAIGWI